MIRTLTTLILLAIHLTSIGQHDFGLRASGGLSYLWTKIFQTGSIQTTQKFSWRPSGQGGLFYNYHIGKSLLGTEILFVQIEGKQHDETPLFNGNGILAGREIVDISQHISYLSIPIYYGYNYKNLNVNIGLQTGIVLFSSGQVKSPDGNGRQLIFNFKKLPIKNYDFGVRAGLVFALTQKIAIEGIYYYGFVNIYQYNIGNFAFKVQQMTIGLKYKLISTSKTKN